MAFVMDKKIFFEESDKRLTLLSENAHSEPKVSKSFKEKFDEIYFDSIDLVQETSIYEDGMAEIKYLRQKLIESLPFNDTYLVDRLISVFVENTTYEYDFAHEKIIEYIDKHLKPRSGAPLKLLR